MANDAVGSIRTIASFCAEERVMDAYGRKCAGPIRQGIRQGIISGLGYGFSFLMLYLTYAICFYAGARFVHDGKATLTEVFRVSGVLICFLRFISHHSLSAHLDGWKVFFALTMAAIGVSQTSALGSDPTKAKDLAASIAAILDRKSKIDSNSEEGMDLANDHFTDSIIYFWIHLK